MNRAGKYKQGEPIFIRVYLKNATDTQTYDVPTAYVFSTDRISLVDADETEVPITRAGRQENESLSNAQEAANETGFDAVRTRVLGPQDEIELKPGPIAINRYFDMTQPGVYHLTFHRISFHENQKYDEPLASNTLTIEVLDEPVTPEDLKDPGEFNFPATEKAGDDENATPDTPAE